MANQYAPPKAHLDDVAPTGGAMTHGMIEALRGTKGWVLLIAVLFFIVTAFSAFSGFMTLVAGGRFMGVAGGGGGMVLGMGVMYLVSTLIYFFLGLYLAKYSSAIGRLVASGRPMDMEDALHSQRKFWRLSGILSLIALVIMVIGILAAITIPAFVGMRH